MSKISTSLLIVASILLVIVCFFNIPSNGMISLIGCAGVVLLVLGCLALGFKDHFSNIEMVNLTSKFVNIVKDILLVGSVLCASLIIDVQYYKWSIALVFLCLLISISLSRILCFTPQKVRFGFHFTIPVIELDRIEFNKEECTLSFFQKDGSTRVIRNIPHSKINDIDIAIKWYQKN